MLFCNVNAFVTFVVSLFIIPTYVNSTPFDCIPSSGLLANPSYLKKKMLFYLTNITLVESILYIMLNQVKS